MNHCPTLSLRRREHGNFGREIFNAVCVKLETVIHSKTKVLRCSTSKSFSLSKIVKQELQLLDSPEYRSANIIKLRVALKAIPPTSAESERTFSAAGLFITKLRTRLNDKSIDFLCLLKS
ncbi:hypothetical protein AVEN_132113-1 [Araneus ventricosus]|uniref:HAT C-terminal dimerisation domain-containing protein n=1 Tax=Araneus ventricosus TaxID=182803 RepID=A0A4Y2I881_ARAVE|nr:hypothetical protein AVEN_132113-1 [Araneus ventricosus]